jgi:cysteine-rich repeat protein
MQVLLAALLLVCLYCTTVAGGVCTLNTAINRSSVKTAVAAAVAKPDAYAVTDADLARMCAEFIEAECGSTDISSNQSMAALAASTATDLCVAIGSDEVVCSASGCAFNANVCAKPDDGVGGVGAVTGGVVAATASLCARGYTGGGCPDPETAAAASQAGVYSWCAHASSSVTAALAQYAFPDVDGVFWRNTRSCSSHNTAECAADVACDVYIVPAHAAPAQLHTASDNYDSACALTEWGASMLLEQRTKLHITSGVSLWLDHLAAVCAATSLQFCGVQPLTTRNLELAFAPACAGHPDAVSCDLDSACTWSDNACGWSGAIAGVCEVYTSNDTCVGGVEPCAWNGAACVGMSNSWPGTAAMCMPRSANGAQRTCNDAETAEGCEAWEWDSTLRYEAVSVTAPSNSLALQCGTTGVPAAHVSETLNGLSLQQCHTGGAADTSPLWAFVHSPPSASGVDTGCGDGVVGGSESCDGGYGCQTNCGSVAGWSCAGGSLIAPDVCGDGVLVPTERCDDGNTAAGDGCSAACTLETGYDCLQSQDSVYTVNSLQRCAELPSAVVLQWLYNVRSVVSTGTPITKWCRYCGMTPTSESGLVHTCLSADECGVWSAHSDCAPVCAPIDVVNCAAECSTPASTSCAEVCGGTAGALSVADEDLFGEGACTGDAMGDVCMSRVAGLGCQLAVRWLRNPASDPDYHYRVVVRYVDHAELNADTTILHRTELLSLSETDWDGSYVSVSTSASSYNQALDMWYLAYQAVPGTFRPYAVGVCDWLTGALATTQGVLRCADLLSNVTRHTGPTVALEYLDGLCYSGLDATGSTTASDCLTVGDNDGAVAFALGKTRDTCEGLRGAPLWLPLQDMRVECNSVLGQYGCCAATSHANEDLHTVGATHSVLTWCAQQRCVTAAAGARTACTGLIPPSAAFSVTSTLNVCPGGVCDWPQSDARQAAVSTLDYFASYIWPENPTSQGVYQSHISAGYPYGYCYSAASCWWWASTGLVHKSVTNVALSTTISASETYSERAGVVVVKCAKYAGVATITHCMTYGACSHLTAISGGGTTYRELTWGECKILATALGAGLYLNGPPADSVSGCNQWYTGELSHGYISTCFWGCFCVNADAVLVSEEVTPVSWDFSSQPDVYCVTGDAPKLGSAVPIPVAASECIGDTLQPSVCGDGVADGSSEGCDDGNLRDGDGCSGGCTVEDGWTCVVVGSMSECAACGNAVVTESIEGCDDGNRVAGDGCSSTCTVEVGHTCELSSVDVYVAGVRRRPSVCEICGNGMRSAAEGCDDGNGADKDGCSSSCTVEDG